MVSLVFINTFRFIGLLAVQVLVLNKLYLGLHINPYIYPLFLLLLPINMSHNLLMLLAFALGITLDIFSNSIGIHASACVFLAFVRPVVLNRMVPKGGFDTEAEPKLGHFGVGWFATYAAILVLLHHIVVFSLEVFNSASIFMIFKMVLINTILSVALMILFEFIFYSKRKRA